MAVKAVGSGPIAITSSAAVHLSQAADAAPSTGAPTFQRDYGWTIAFKTDGPLHFGGSTVTNTGSTRGALFDAGFYAFDLSGDDQLYAIAPSGQTVHVEILQIGVQAS